MSSPGYLGYAYGECTRLVAEAVDWIGQWGNAKDWAPKAAAAGFAEGPASLGSLADWAAGAGGAGPSGHVAEVVGFGPTALPIVYEQNWGLNGVGFNHPDYRELSPAEAAAAVYIEPPQGARLPVPVSPTAVAGPDQPRYDATSPVPGAILTSSSSSGAAATAPGVPQQLGTQFSGWVTSTGHSIANAVRSDILGFLIGAVVLYLFYAKDFGHVKELA